VATLRYIMLLSKISFQNAKYKYELSYGSNMPKITLTFDAWQCSNCLYKWKGKTNEKPLRCPDCGTCLWDRPRKNEEVNEDGRSTE